MLAKDRHPRVIVADTIAKLRSYTNGRETSIEEIVELLGHVEDAAAMNEVFVASGATALTESPPDVSNGIVHVHIMKTAGTSFFDGLQRASQGGGIWINYDVLAMLPHGVRSSTPIIAGHFPYEARKLIGMDRKYLTVLRDPRERTLSHFHNIWNTPDVINEVGELSLEDFLWNERWAGLASNYQTRQLGFEVGVESLGREWSALVRFSLISAPFPVEHTFPLCSLFDSLPISDWTDTFQRAVSALSAIDLILTTESLDVAPRLVAEVTGFEMEPVPQLNTRTYTGFNDLPRNLQVRIDEINQCDAELWRLARQRVSKDVAEITG